MSPQEPKPVKFFVAIMWKKPAALARAFDLLQQSWGELDYQGLDHPFDGTNYYETEMGTGLMRRLVSFADVRSPEDLAQAKVKCMEFEAKVSQLPNGTPKAELLEEPTRPEVAPTPRLVNLDIGYLDHNKIVLASVKGLGQKIYLSHGIYADLVARFGHGKYQPFEWTFPDFKSGRYDAELGTIRENYLRQLKALK